MFVSSARLSLLGALLCALLATSVAADAPAATERSPALALAERDWAEGEAQRAIIRLKEHLQNSSNDAAARLLLGRIYLDMGDAPAAEQELTRARAAGADDMATRIGLTEALLGQGETTRAMEWTEPTSDASAADRAELLALRGSILLTQLQTAEAAQAFAAALDAEPKSLRANLGMATLEARRGDFTAARESIEHVLALHPASAEAWQALATLETLVGNRLAAIDAYTRAMDYARITWPLLYQRAAAHLDALNTDAAAADIEALRSQHARLPGLDYLGGRLSLLRGDNEAAVEQLERYLRVAPSDPEAIYYAAFALNRNGLYAQAEEYLVRLAVSAPDNAAAMALLARTRLALGNAPGAEEAIRPIAEADTGTPMALELLRMALVRQGRTEEAAQLVERAAERFSDLPSAQLAYAAQLQQDGDAAGSVDLLKRVVEAEPGNERARMLLIRGLVIAGDVAAARSAADEFLSRTPESAVAHTIMGAVLTQQGDREGARAAFNQALSLEPTSERAALALAALELGADRPEQARDTLDGLLEVDPENVNVTLIRAAMERRDGGAEGYRQRLREALARKPEALRLRLALIGSELADGNNAAAREALKEALPEQRTETPLLMAKARIEIADGQTTAAQTTLADLATRNPTMARYPFMLASLQAETGDYRAAATSLANGLALDQAGELEHRRLARILAAHPTPSAREDLMTRLLSVAPQHPVVRAAQARMQIDRREFDAAVETLLELAEAYPEDPTYPVSLADAYSAAGRAAQARQVLTEWLDAHPEHAPARLRLAQLGIDAGDFDLAMAQYRRILETSPNNRVALNNLAMLLAETSPDEALVHANRALALSPEDPAFIDTKATVLMAGGDLAAALPLLAKAHANSSDPSIAYRYAKALAASGDGPAARRVLLALQAKAFPEKPEADALLSQLTAER
jgi:putative PEP-CTERM system TPR-repeat lipoprotein